MAGSATIVNEVIRGVRTPVDKVGGGSNATFYALNANTGAVIWQTRLSSQAGSYIWSSPAVYNGSIYVGLSSLVSAGPLWQVQLALPSSEGVNISSSAWNGTNLYVAATKTTINGVLYIGNADGIFYAFGT